MTMQQVPLDEFEVELFQRLVTIKQEGALKQKNKSDLEIVYNLSIQGRWSDVCSMAEAEGLLLTISPKIQDNSTAAVAHIVKAIIKVLVWNTVKFLIRLLIHLPSSGKPGKTAL